MPAALYSSLLFVHVLAALFLVGNSLQSLFLRRQVLNAGSSADLRSWVMFALRASRFNPLFALILLTTGVALGAAGWWTSAWFFVSIAVWIMNGALAGGVVKRSLARLAEAAGSAPALTPEVDRMRRSRVLVMAENAVLANDVVILYVMMSKPGLAACLILLFVAQGVALAASTRRASVHSGAEATPSAA